MEDGRGWCPRSVASEPIGRASAAEADGYDLRPEALNAAMDQVQAVLDNPEIERAVVVAFRRICVGLFAASAENLKLRAELAEHLPPPIAVGSIWSRKQGFYDQATVVAVWALLDGRTLIEVKGNQWPCSQVKLETTFRAEWKHREDL